MRSFWRSYRLEIGDKKITDLDIEFEVRKTLKKEPNTASVRVYNLSESTRRAMQGQDLPVTLNAGYVLEYPISEDMEAVLSSIGIGAESSTVPMLYSGTLRYAASSQDEAMNWVTSVASGDGDRGLSKARTSRTYRAGTPWLVILQDLAGDLGVGAGNLLSLSSSAELALKRLGKGRAVHGATEAQLSRMLDASGYDWSIQDGALQVLAHGATISTMAVDLSAKTGLIGSPEMALRTDTRGGGKDPKKAIKQPEHFIRARSLLNAALQPGQKVKIDAAMISGYYRVESVQHFGTFSASGGTTPWFSDIEATEI